MRQMLNVANRHRDTGTSHIGLSIYIYIYIFYKNARIVWSFRRRPYGDLPTIPNQLEDDIVDRLLVSTTRTYLIRGGCCRFLCAFFLS